MEESEIQKQLRAHGWPEEQIREFLSGQESQEIEGEAEIEGLLSRLDRLQAKISLLQAKQAVTLAKLRHRLR